MYKISNGTLKIFSQLKKNKKVGRKQSRGQIEIEQQECIIKHEYQQLH